MMFNTDWYDRTLKLAYRRVLSAAEGFPYSFDEVLHVYQYYFETYELIFGEAHPLINLNQTANIIFRMPFTDTEDEDEIEITPEMYEALIDQHFATKYKRCDYNINHFFSGLIRTMRYYECLNNGDIE